MTKLAKNLKKYPINNINFLIRLGSLVDTDEQPDQNNSRTYMCCIKYFGML